MNENPHIDLFDQFLKSFQDRINQLLITATALLTLFTFILPEKTAQWLVGIFALLVLIIWVWRFVQSVRKYRETYDKVAQLPRSALRGLLPFEEGDELFGRNADVMSLSAIINDRDFCYGVVSGDSGCGKTSLLRAGILPQLRKNNILPLYISSPTKDPRDSIENQIRNDFPDFEQGSKDILEQLRSLSKKEKKKIVVIFDQFEEFFVSNRSTEGRVTFAKWLGKTSDKLDNSAGFLLVIRKDFFIDLHEFYPHVSDPTPAKYTYLVHNFDLKISQDILLLLAKSDGVRISETLAQNIVEGLESEGIVRPAELQIVGSQVVRKRIVTAKEFENVGRSSGILSSHIIDAIKNSPDSRVSSLILRMMCSENGITKTTSDSSLEQIVESLKSSGVEDVNRISKNFIQHILDYFIQSRVVLATKGNMYNLVHDYLAPQIFEATKDTETATEQANRLLKKYIALYHDDHRVKVPYAAYQKILKYASDDLKKDKTATQVLLASRGGYAIRQIGFVALTMIVFIIFGSAFYIYNLVYISSYIPYPDQPDRSQVVLRRGIPLRTDKDLPIMGDIILETDFQLNDIRDESAVRYNQFTSNLFEDPFRAYSSWGDQLVDSLPFNEERIRYLLWLGRETDAVEMVNSPELVKSANIWYYIPYYFGSDFRPTRINPIPLMFYEQISDETIEYWETIANTPSEDANLRSDAIWLLYQYALVSPQKYEFDIRLLDVLYQQSVNRESGMLILIDFVSKDRKLLNDKVSRLLIEIISDDGVPLDTRAKCAGVLLDAYLENPKQYPLNKDQIAKLFQISLSSQGLSSQIDRIIQEHPEMITRDWLISWVANYQKIEETEQAKEYAGDLFGIVANIVIARPDLLDSMMVDELLAPLSQAKKIVSLEEQRRLGSVEMTYRSFVNLLRPDLLFDGANTFSPSDLYSLVQQSYKDQSGFSYLEIPSLTEQLRLVFKVLSPEFITEFESLMIEAYKNQSGSIVGGDFEEVRSYCGQKLAVINWYFSVVAPENLSDDVVQFLVDDMLSVNSKCVIDLYNTVSDINQAPLKRALPMEKAKSIESQFRNIYQEAIKYFNENKSDGETMLSVLLEKYPEAFIVGFLYDLYPELEPPTPVAPTPTPDPIVTLTPNAFAVSLTSTAISFTPTPMPAEIRPTPTQFSDDDLKEVDDGVVGWQQYFYVGLSFGEGSLFSNPNNHSKIYSYCITMINAPERQARSKGIFTCYYLSAVSSDYKEQLRTYLEQMRQHKNPQKRFTAGKLGDMLIYLDLIDFAKQDPSQTQRIKAILRVSLLTSDIELQQAASYALSQIP